MNDVVMETMLDRHVSRNVDVFPMKFSVLYLFFLWYF